MLRFGFKKGLLWLHMTVVNGTSCIATDLIIELTLPLVGGEFEGDLDHEAFGKGEFVDSVFTENIKDYGLVETVTNFLNEVRLALPLCTPLGCA